MHTPAPSSHTTWTRLNVEISQHCMFLGEKVKTNEKLKEIIRNFNYLHILKINILYCEEYYNQVKIRSHLVFDFILDHLNLMVECSSHLWNIEIRVVVLVLDCFKSVVCNMWFGRGRDFISEGHKMLGATILESGIWHL